jgi:DNA-directed RNA polymerase specialized sigma24 family protein
MVGDDELFRALYPGLRRFAAAVGPLEVDPDDLVQDALVRCCVGGR